MRLTLLLLLLLLNLSQLRAQIFISPYYLQPRAKMGQVLKPLYSLEAGYSDFFNEDEHWRGSVSFGVQIFHPRADTFRIYGSSYENGNTTVYPGYQVYNKYINAYVSITADWSPTNFNNFYPYIGIGLIAGYNYYQGEYVVQSITDATETLGSPLAGLRATLGVDYYFLDDFCAFLQYSPSFYGVFGEHTTQNFANQYGIGFRYNFKN